MTNEEVSGCGAAYEKAGQYIQRWKVERFHYVLKSGCKAWKMQERMNALILMYPVISVFLLNLTYLARINPGLSCEVMFEEAERKMLYCAARRGGGSAGEGVHDKGGGRIYQLAGRHETCARRRTGRGQDNPDWASEIRLVR